MRNIFLVPLLLLLVLPLEVQGIRLEQGFMTVGHQRIHEEESSLIEARSGGVGEVILCKDGHCSGRSRKLMAKTISTSTTTTASSKSVKNGGTQVDPMSKGQSSDKGLGNEENFSLKSSPVSEQREVSPEHYPADIIDIADYSPAKRKSPIHN